MRKGGRNEEGAREVNQMEFDLSKFDSYREDNRLEVKKAGG